LSRREAIFFVLTTHLILLSSSLISHLHTLLLLAPPPYYPSRCPPRNPIRHIILLSNLVLDPPTIDVGVLQALCASEETLRKGSKSFTLAKLGWEREIRCGLVAVYGWCRITVSLEDVFIGNVT
jgi:15-cis-phytoene synthase/lycopene beta-cyclase